MNRQPRLTIHKIPANDGRGHSVRYERCLYLTCSEDTHTAYPPCVSNSRIRVTEFRGESDAAYKADTDLPHSRFNLRACFSVQSSDASPNSTLYINLCAPLPSFMQAF